MRIALDYDTVVSTAPTSWRKFAEDLYPHELIILSSESYLKDAMEWSVGLPSTAIQPTVNKQAQDLVGADIWIHGRPDRVIGVEQIHSLYTMLNQA